MQLKTYQYIQIDTGEGNIMFLKDLCLVRGRWMLRQEIPGRFYPRKKEKLHGCGMKCTWGETPIHPFMAKSFDRLTRRMNDKLFIRGTFISEGTFPNFKNIAHFQNSKAVG